MKRLCICGRRVERGEKCECQKKKENQQQQGKPYNNKRWINYSLRFRENYPLCAHCLREGKLTSIHPKDGKNLGVVDHIRRIDGTDDPGFWTPYNHQGLCQECHNQKTNKENAGNYTEEMIQQDLRERREQLDND